MGYDMYVAGLPDDGRTRWDRANDEPNSYLRRNIWGIGHFCDALLRCDMAFDGPAPAFPRSQIDWNDGTHWDDAGEPVSDEARSYQDVVDRVLVTHGEGHAPGIPLWKFSSNDGWHVTAVECEQALDAYVRYRADDNEHPEEFRDDVIPFLRLAARHDGFKVF
jgi:hypothetical protein